MTTLSIRDAAAEHPDRPALITESAQLTFAQLAAACGPPPPAIVATPTIETVVAIVSALEAERPIVLHHPRTPGHPVIGPIADAPPPPPGTLAIVFTSGSTGAPRPIALRRDHAIGAATASAAHLGWRDDDAWLLCLPLAHVGGLAIIIRCLLARRPVILARSHPAATLASVVPAQLAELAAGPGMRAILLGGAAAPVAVRTAAIARGLPILTTYGMTETWGQVATQPLARAGQLDDGVGVPLPGVVITAGTPASPAPIRIDGPMCPTITTADLGYLDARGWLHVTGRADDIIITGGENVHPSTIEDALASAPGVIEVAAYGVPDPRWGQRIVAAVVLAPGAPLDPIVAHAAALPAHHRPRDFVVVPALPRTPSGKLDRRALSAR